MNLVLTNGKVVTPTEVVAGTVVVRDGCILDVQPGGTGIPAALDLQGDYLLPGAVDLHTDNLERHVAPRRNARWPSRQAMVSHDAECAAAGVTTVLDALSCGDNELRPHRNAVFRSGVADLRALADAELLRAEHFLHIRCELLALDVLDRVGEVIDDPRVRLLSLTDHGPGVGQFADPDAYRAVRLREGWDRTVVERTMVEQVERRARMRGPNTRALAGLAAGRSIVLASHDDRLASEITANRAAGITISEFPVTMEAAEAAGAQGMHVVAGAPNIVRGGSHSGNVAASELLRRGVVDAFASDYVPSSLIDAVFRCVSAFDLALPQAVSLIAERPARMVGLTDRGRLEAGQRADVVQVRVHEGVPVVRQVWRQGKRIA